MTDFTPGPWVQFVDQGKCVAIMPAGRDGDICTFNQPPTDADARLMTAAPQLLKALEIARKWMPDNPTRGMPMARNDVAIVEEALRSARVGGAR